MRDWILLAMFIAAAQAAFGQTAPGMSPSFGAAAVKPNRSGENGRQTMTPGRIAFTGTSLRECVMAAWELRTWQVDGPASLDSERYDIFSTAEGPAANPELRVMLKTLLADPFGLKFHIESRELRSYRLVVAKNQTKLTRAPADQPPGYALESGAVVFHSTSMAALADYLSHRAPVDRPVIDATGIEGRYDFQLKLFDVHPEIPLNEINKAYYDWDQGAAIFTDLQEQLGFKLESARSPLDVLVVDSIIRPSGN